ncbi:MAG: hypothetical protein ACP5OG_02585 [Candidatus Nanoarchaeia archaeon]
MKKDSEGSIKNTFCIFVLIFAMTFAGIFLVSAAEPYGASDITNISETRAPMDDATARTAFAGNVSEINIFSYSTTQSWHGFYGNVTGVIQLADNNDNVMYNWSDFSPSGEIYASTNGTGIIWNNIQCFNFTATGEFDTGEVSLGGTTNERGMNYTQLEDFYGINHTRPDPDGIDETFNFSGATGHNGFFTNNWNFSKGECKSTRLFDNSGTGVEYHFEEVLLYEPFSSSVVFATILMNDLLGFDGRHHDFQLMVPENGHGTDTATTTYYFYVELG